MTAKIDLTDLFDLFAKTEEKPPIDPPISPEARRWRANFTDQCRGHFARSQTVSAGG